MKDKKSMVKHIKKDMKEEKDIIGDAKDMLREDQKSLKTLKSKGKK